MEGEHWEAVPAGVSRLPKLLMTGIPTRSDANVEVNDGAMSNDNCSCHAQVVGLSHTDSSLREAMKKQK